MAERQRPKKRIYRTQEKSTENPPSLFIVLLSSILFKEEDYNKRSHRNSKMISTLIGNKDPNLQFEILVYPQYQNEHGQPMCYPGSVMEGVVKVTNRVRMPLHHIKLVFKATERVNYDAMGWEKSKTTDDRLFAVRTVLWGLPVGTHVPYELWPVLETGEHLFPFTCQMPVINFPPSFGHHLIATAFHMIVSVERPSQAPLLSKPITLQFHPIIETMPVKNLHALVQDIRLTQHLSAQVSIPRLAYDVYEPGLTIPLHLLISQPYQEASHTLSHLQASLKRTYQINYKSFSRRETTTLVSRSVQKLASNTLTLALRPQLPLEPTLTYSHHLSIQYRLVLTAKVRHGPLNLKKKLLDLPITLGTLPPGIAAPRQLEPYSSLVENRAHAFSKPTFLRPEPIQDDDCLPPYESESIPPSYHTILPSIPSVY
ncbi:hypothetical protein BY458DRAFT_493180 [Sporodiniella umbellata]|nr:hypothetical protein BY458DRAFT_493180 [Sporodiniella umbellata]